MAEYTHTIRQSLLDLRVMADNMEDPAMREFCRMEVRLLTQIVGYVSTYTLGEKLMKEL